MKRIFLLFVCLLFVFSLIPSVAKSAVQISEIVITPPIVGKTLSMKIKMSIGISLTTNQCIYIKFPDEFEIPKEIDPKNVRIGLLEVNPSVIYIEGNVISLVLKSNLSKFEGLDSNGFCISISEYAGIKNPSQRGNYNIQVWTDVEKIPVEYQVYIGEEGEPTGTQVDSVLVEVSDNFAGRNAAYKIIFNNNGNSFLSSYDGDYVDILFPEGTTLPEKIGNSKVLLNYGQSSKVEINGLFLRVYLPETWVISFGARCEIVIQEDFGIYNSSFTGTYAVQVATSKDKKLAMSNQYSIIGTKVLNLFVSISPDNQGSVSEIKVDFKSSENGGLIKGKDKIFIKFPKDFFLPNEIDKEKVTVNNMFPIDALFVENILSFSVPTNIGKNNEITVVLKKEIGIVNPLDVGTYKVAIATSSDAEFVPFYVSITPSKISDLFVSLSNCSANQNSEYYVSFKTGIGGALQGLVDKLNITFPKETIIPVDIKTISVLVNDLPCSKVEVSSDNISAVVPQDLPAQSTMKVTFKIDAGIINPKIPNDYKLIVNTSKELELIYSNVYTIKSVPQTKYTIIPALPDGLNDFYKVKPTITFSSSSPTDSNPLIYYYFDSNQPVLYNNTSVTAPEGVHTLFYYAVDKEGYKEETKPLQIKVDTIPPVITVFAPLNNAVLNSSAVLVKGNVDVGSSLKINAETVQVDGIGNFETTVNLQNNSDVINISAVDIAGNFSQVSITVSVDTTPPPLTVTKPIMFQQVGKLPVIVEGKTEPGASVTVSGLDATVNADGIFTYLLTKLPEGTLSTIEVVATDAAGNFTKRSVSVKFSKSVVLILQVSNVFALINGQTKTLEAPPIISSGRTMVPLRFIGEIFGAEFEYEPITKTIDITFGSDKITMQIGKKTAVVNGKQVELDVAPYIVNGRTLVPIRFILETFGADVVWDGTTKTVTIIYPKQ